MTIAERELIELQERVEAWCEGDPDPQAVSELRSLLEAQAIPELLHRFLGPLEFGTAGLRGILGAGPNRMNRAVVRRATAGLARYLKAVSEVRSRGVVIGRDARKMSWEFALDAAGVFAAEGIPVHFFELPVPTPLVAFATLHLKAACGVMVTASHNPPEYNGYKVYWANGAQVIPPHDQGIADEMERVEPANRVPIATRELASQGGLWNEVSPEVGEAYLAALLKEQRHPAAKRDLRVVYTPLHGLGGWWVREVMARAGIEDLFVVPTQEQPDGAFPTVRFPNPEEPTALDQARALAESVGADLVLANDPDVDRLAVIARDGDQRLRALSGDELGTLLGCYLLGGAAHEKATPLALSTIVSSLQLKEVALACGARYEQTLTGFKWIANRALALEHEEGLRFVFGYEEALGYSVGTVVRDKDGIGAALAVVDMACWCRARKMTLVEYLDEIEREYGVFQTRQQSFTFAETSGGEVIRRIMNGFRQWPPSSIAGKNVVSTRDFHSGKQWTSEGFQELNLPRSNLLVFELSDGSRVCLRPSGTEPKIKYYFEVKEPLRVLESVWEARARSQRRLEALVNSLAELARQRGQPAPSPSST